MNWIDKAAQSSFMHLMEFLTLDLGKAVTGLLSRLLLTPMGLLEDLDLLELIRYARMLAWLILPLILIRHGMTIAQNRAEGSATESVENFVRRAVIATAAVASTTIMTEWMMRFADSVISSFLGADTGLTPLTMLTTLPPTPSAISMSLILLVLALIIGFVVLVVQRAILNATLALTMAVGPIAATSLAWGDSALWNTWLRELISILLTYVFQTVMLWWLLRKIGSWSADSFESKFLVMGTLIVMLKVPATIRQWTYAAGGGSAIVGGGAQVAQSVVMMRMVRATSAAVIKR